MNVKRADWVTCKGSSMVGTVQRVARDGSWCDVKWSLGHTKRMPASSLTVQTTIQRGEWQITDITRQKEMEA